MTIALLESAVWRKWRYKLLHDQFPRKNVLLSRGSNLRLSEYQSEGHLTELSGSAKVAGVLTYMWGLKRLQISLGQSGTAYCYWNFCWNKKQNIYTHQRIALDEPILNPQGSYTDTPLNTYATSEINEIIDWST